jgi:capsular polysaccharide biosynthesis protein
LNVFDRCRPTPEIHLQVENYYFSSPTSWTGCDNPYAIRFLRDRFLKSAALLPVTFEKIYISRRGTSRQALHEEDMIDFLQGEGWTVLQAENYSFREQIALFSNARAVCSLHGAALANLVWCQKGCKALELCPANFLNGCYEGLAAYVDVDYRFLVFEADRQSRLKVDLHQFTAAIKALDA